MVFYDCLFSFSFMFSSWIYLVVCIHFLSLSSNILAYGDTIICLPVNWLTDSWVVSTSFHFSWKYPGMNLLGHFWTVWHFQPARQFFSSECTLIYIPISNVWGLMNTSLPLKSFPSLSLTLMGPTTLLTLLDILLWESWPINFWPVSTSGLSLEGLVIHQSVAFQFLLVYILLQELKSFYLGPSTWVSYLVYCPQLSCGWVATRSRLRKNY